MEILNCSSIKTSLIDFLRTQVEVASFTDRCVITLPIKTLDDRLVDVVVERKLSDFFVVHDAGKTLNELFVQGISITDIKKTHLEAMARQFGVELSGEVFKIGCKIDKLQNAILAISQCSTLAMFELLSHRPEVEEEPLSSRVGRSLKKWQPSFVKSIERHVAIRGKKFPHYFDFVTFAEDEKQHHTTAVKLLPPTYSGTVQAERYAYLVLDIEETFFNAWARLAVVTKVETWPLPALEMVRGLSKEILEIRTGEEDSIEDSLPSTMNLLVA